MLLWDKGTFTLLNAFTLLSAASLREPTPWPSPLHTSWHPASHTTTLIQAGWTHCSKCRGDGRFHRLQPAHALVCVCVCHMLHYRWLQLVLLLPGMCVSALFPYLLAHFIFTWTFFTVWENHLVQTAHSCSNKAIIHSQIISETQ